MDILTAVDEVAQELPFNIAPNILTGGDQVRISFDLDHRHKISIQVYDLQGKIILTFPSRTIPGGESTFTLDAPMNSGVYFYRVMAGSRAGVRKVVVR